MIRRKVQATGFYQLSVSYQKPKRFGQILVTVPPRFCLLRFFEKQELCQWSWQKSKWLNLMGKRLDMLVCLVLPKFWILSCFINRYFHQDLCQILLLAIWCQFYWFSDDFYYSLFSHHPMWFFKALTSTTASAGGNNRIAQLEEENRELKKGIIVIIIQTLQEEMKVFMAGPPPSPSNFCIHLYF